MGPVKYPAPAAIVIGEPRRYGAVPAIGERASTANKASAGTKAS
jgi:itaconate CoA-transferase